jgi:hypothetical protein
MRAHNPVTVSGLFSDPDATFEVPHQVSKVIASILSSELADTHAFDENFGKDYYLCLMRSSRVGLADLEIKGPTISKRYKTVEFSLKMPHRKIVEDPRRYGIYLDYMERGTSSVFAEIGLVTKRPMADIFREIRARCFAPDFVASLSTSAP